MEKQKELIVQKLKDSGCRITKQRLMILDIILEEECSCCKEIYYRASRWIPILEQPLSTGWLISWKRSEPSTEKICIRWPAEQSATGERLV